MQHLKIIELVILIETTKKSLLLNVSDDTAFKRVSAVIAQKNIDNCENTLLW